MILLYQLITIILGIFIIILTISRFRNGKMSFGMLMVWILIWFFIIIIALYPNLTNYFATITGIGRGLDFILIIGLLLSFYMIFKMYNKIETVEEELTDLIRELAIQRENVGLKEKEDVKCKDNLKSHVNE